MNSRRSQRIMSLTLDYVAQGGISATPSERKVESFQRAYAEEVPYFIEHPEYWGFYPIKGDPLGRHVFWLLRKGEGDKTVVLIHHSDVVEVSDYGSFEEFAFSPLELEEKYLQQMDTLSPSFAEDVRSGKYLFGRGTADMKGGGAIQLTLLEEYCNENDFHGNVLVLAVPDEESLSSGMRGALPLLEDLHEKYALDYVFLFNSEPYYSTGGNRVLSLGSVGKLLFFVYVKGKLSHIGMEKDGLNPMGLLGRVMSESEQRPIFFERAGEEISPSPVWVYARDNKLLYDASMVTGAFGCMSLLFFQKEPQELSEIMETFLKKTFRDYLESLQQSHRESGDHREVSWVPEVLSFADFSSDVEGVDWQAEKTRLEEMVMNAQINYVEATRRLMETMMRGRRKDTPVIVYGLIPPYYPGVCSAQDDLVISLLEELRGVSKERFETEQYFTGISDLSYTRTKGAQEAVEVMNSLMPFYGRGYSIAFDILEKWQLPGINIGPMGFDLHKKEERVLKEDLLIKAPKLLDHAIRFVLGM
ncbi:MAG: M20/M25/M40 family metallo-hydrolase [Tissierellia bacterium]|nr:M20/M25/M40 family metallo-hydrolase [Bacillota bacterium]NLL23262.1 M20/M25/M40 family metallo-hydrolase [Tissierellia bacterium]